VGLPRSFIKSMNLFIKIICAKFPIIKIIGFLLAKLVLSYIPILFNLYFLTILKLLKKELPEWVIIFVYLPIGLYTLYFYLQYIPYYDTAISVIWGTISCSIFWVTLNYIFGVFIKINGHMLILISGLFLIGGIIYNYRKMYIEKLCMLRTEEITTETESLIQLSHFHQMLISQINSQNNENSNSNNALQENALLSGIINQHISECENAECICHSENLLYDPSILKMQNANLPKHCDQIFVKHFIKLKYEECINKFTSSSINLRIAFSNFLFHIMKNVSSALICIDELHESKLGIKEEFSVFRHKKNIEHFLITENKEGKKIYLHLTDIVQFENLISDCHSKVEEVCNSQIDFWSQIGVNIPDLNILYEIGQKIYILNSEVEEIWEKISKINPNYPRALLLYGNYLCDLRNHSQLGGELLEQARIKTQKKSIDEFLKSSDLLFADDTAVLHISGKKGKSGKITQMNDVVTKLFGYRKAEILDADINVLMPRIYAHKHNEFLTKHYQTGYKTNTQENRILYGLHRNGYCFALILYVKVMPTLDNGLEFVGMIRQVQEECDYIIMDSKGKIDSVSSGLATALNIETKLIRSFNINVQIIAPQLLNVFTNLSKERSKKVIAKFKESGGHSLLLIVPKDFNNAINMNIQERKIKQNAKNIFKKQTSTRSISSMPLYYAINKRLNSKKQLADHKDVSVSQLLATLEYRENEFKITVKCEILENTYGDKFGETDPLKVWVMKIYGLQNKLDKNKSDDSENYKDDAQSNGSLIMKTPMNLSKFSKFKFEAGFESAFSKIPHFNKCNEQNSARQQPLLTLEKSEAETIRIPTNASPVFQKPPTEKPVSQSDSNSRSKSSSRRYTNYGDKEEKTFTLVPRNSIPQIVVNMSSPKNVQNSSSLNSHEENKSAYSEDKKSPTLYQQTLVRVKSIEEDSIKGIKPAVVKIESKKNFLAVGSSESNSLKSASFKPISAINDEKVEFLPKINLMNMNSDENSIVMNTPRLDATCRSGSSMVGMGDKAISDFLKITAKKKPTNKSRPRTRKISNKIMTNPLYDPDADLDNPITPQVYAQTEEEQKLRRNLWEYDCKRKHITVQPEAKTQSQISETKKENNEDTPEGSPDAKSPEDQNETNKDLIAKSEDQPIEQTNEEDTQSSVDSSASSIATRSFNSFRTAIEEKYVPRSVKNMSFLAILVFILLFAISSIFFMTLFKKI